MISGNVRLRPKAVLHRLLIKGEVPCHSLEIAGRINTIIYMEVQGKERYVMKYILIVFMALFVVGGCVANKTFVKIQQVEEIYAYGQLQYMVNSGDVLEVVLSKTCRTGFDECWKVRNIATGEIGFVRVKDMKERHYVYTEKDGKEVPLEE